MGFKRPFDDEELQELPFKNPRQFGSNNKLTRFADSNSPQKPHISVEVENAFRKDQWSEESKTDAVDDVTRSVDEKDTGIGVAAILPDYVDCDFPRRTISSVDDDYYLLLDRSPRKQVPLGPNHQANVPSWGKHTKNIKFVQNDALETVDNDNEDIMKMGTCIIPFPNSVLSENGSDKVGAGRTKCSCLDKGSIRCVQQHVIEARKQLQKSLGHEKFVKLGFYNMGEDVAYKWSEEDEEIFREVVYNNPVSFGRKFWNHLSEVFPSRSKRELVSYYFNVFILQRRAIQNRSSSLDIDSDDDELYENQQSYKSRALEEDEDSAIDSLSDQEDLANHDDDSDVDDDSDNFDGGDNRVGYYSSCLSNRDYGTKSFDESSFDPVFQQTDMGSGIVDDFNRQQDSCMSFEFEPNMVDPRGLIDTKANLHENGMKTEISQQQSKLDESKEPTSNVYLLDSFDTKIWDTTTSTEGIDLQLTSNIIEDIFGQNS